MINLVDFPVEFSSATVKNRTGTFTEEIKPIVQEKKRFDDRYESIGSVFAVFFRITVL